MNPSECDWRLHTMKPLLSQLANRLGAPLATDATDRHCLYNVCQGLRDNTVESLICFWFPRRFPDRRIAVANPTSWHDPAMTVRSCDGARAVEYNCRGVLPDVAENSSCLETYVDKNGQGDPEGNDLR